MTLIGGVTADLSLPGLNLACNYPAVLGVWSAFQQWGRWVSLSSLGVARLPASHGQWRPLVLLLEEALSAVGRKGKAALAWNVAQVITCALSTSWPGGLKPPNQGSKLFSDIPTLCVFTRAVEGAR